MVEKELPPPGTCWSAVSAVMHSFQKSVTLYVVLLLTFQRKPWSPVGTLLPDWSDGHCFTITHDGFEPLGSVVPSVMLSGL